MKKFLFISLIFILSNCGGYEPVFSGKEINFYIEEIENIKNDKISKQIIRRLKPYTIKTDKTNIKLKIESSVEDRIVSKDAKGNPVVFELIIKVKIKIYSNMKQKNLDYVESFSFNNQSNKFELSQYKKNIEKNLINTIFEKFILNLKSNL